MKIFKVKKERNRKYGFGNLFWLAAFFVLLLPNSLAADEKHEKPNIVILLADDMGYGDLGIYGSEMIPTPNIDRLSEEGMYFTNAYSPGPTCIPTRYALLTGRYYWRSEVKTRGDYGYATPRIEPEDTTLPEFLQKNGYQTAIVGKWHLGLQWGLKAGSEWAGNNGENIDYNKPVENGPFQHGFDYYFGMAGSLDMPPWVFIENDRTVGIPSADKVPRNTLQWERGGLMAPGWRDEDVGPVLAEKATAFIRSHAEGEPRGQLYNLDTDMSETKNLWNSHPDIVQKLKRLLKEYKNRK